MRAVNGGCVFGDRKGLQDKISAAQAGFVLDEVVVRQYVSEALCLRVFCILFSAGGWHEKTHFTCNVFELRVVVHRVDCWEIQGAETQASPRPCVASA